MVLIASAKYLPIEFQVEIGSMPPSFLPIGNKRLYEYQRALFENIQEKIFLSLPQSFNIDKMDQDKLKILGIEVLFVPDNLSLGESIVYCINLNLPLDSKEGIKILFGDTYFDSLEFCQNSLVIHKTPNNYNWQYLDETLQLLSDIEDKRNFVISGYFEITDAYFLIQSIVKCQYNFNNGIKLYTTKSVYYT
ncbi:MAG: capsular biosynthesis protein, partial [Helicobacter sp.]|nr:capsular biosynthesis protein [Helicobacter sp.]